MTRSAVRRLAAPLVACLAVAVTACGTPQHIAVALPESGATLEGTVRYGPDDVHYAFILIQAADGQASAGKVDEEGRYKVPNAPLGEVKIAVNTSAARGDYQAAMMRAGAMTGGPEGKAGRKKVNVQFVALPAKYFDPNTSGLKTTVNGGSNTYDIVIPK